MKLPIETDVFSRQEAQLSTSCFIPASLPLSMLLHSQQLILVLASVDMLRFDVLQRVSSAGPRLFLPALLFVKVLIEELQHLQSGSVRTSDRERDTIFPPVPDFVFVFPVAPVNIRQSQR